MSLKLRAGLGLATVILTIVSIIGGAVTRLETRFAALDTRLGKLESAIKVINAEGTDEKYRQLVKELMAQRDAEEPNAAKRSGPHGIPVYGIKGITDGQGAAADAPAVKVPQ